MLDLTQIITPVYGAVSGGTVDTSSWQPENFKGLIEIAIRTLFIVGGLAFVILFLIGAVRYITSGGDAKAVDGAKKNLTAAVVGVLILASVYTVAWFFNRTLGAPTFGGIVTWQGSGGPGPSTGVRFHGDYSLCKSDLPTVYNYSPSCTAGNVPCCYAKNSQDCINMGAVVKYYPTDSAGKETVLPCATSGGVCNAKFVHQGPINWDAWTDYVVNGGGRDTADTLCEKCNICGN